MNLSVIIPTRNRAELLDKALRSLVDQTMPQSDFEVIVVDNGSTDRTLEVVASYKSRMGSLRYFLEQEPGLHVGRHKGLAEAASDLLVYADDDIEAFPTWLQAIESSFGDEQVVLVGGKCLPAFEAEPAGWLRAMWAPNARGERILAYLSLIDLGDGAMAVSPYHVFGCNFAIRRSVLVEAGGFHPDAMPQELIRFRGDGESYVLDFVKAKGLKAHYNPSASVKHWVPADRMTPEYFRRRAFSQGISDSYAAIRRAGGVAQPAAAHSPDPCGGTSISRLLGTVWRRTRALVLGASEGGDPAGAEPSLRGELDVAYRTGHDYHQAQVRRSPELLAWVLRDHYRDGRLPSLGCEE